MPRKRDYTFRKFFTVDESTNNNVCKIVENDKKCGKILKTDHASNLASHIKSMHKGTWEKIISDSEKPRKSLKPIPSKVNNNNDRSVLSMLNPKVNITMTKDVLIKSCVELCTVNGRPFSIVEDSGFRKIVDPIVQSLGDVSINRKNIKNEVLHKYKKVTDIIANEMQGKLVSIKIDGLTHLNRAFLGINAQFISNGKIVLRTLAVAELFERHTAEHLRDITVSILHKYKVKTDQIYSCTTDNARNMLKCISLLSESDDNDDSDEDNFSGELNYNENDDESELDKTLENFHFTNKCIAVRCAAHTLQLAITSFLTNKEIEKTIVIARSVVKKLRTPNITILLKNQGLKKPIIDCVTRWSSTFEMLSSLTEKKIKEFCINLAQANDDFFISPIMWQTIERVVEALHPANVATKVLQKEQLTFGDAYDAWCNCKIQLKKIKNNFSISLLDKIKMKEEQLFENDAFIAAILIDPRWNVILKGSIKERAIEHTIRTIVKMKSISQQDIEIVDEDINTSSESSFDCLEAILKNIEKENSEKDQNVRDLLNSFLKEKRVPLMKNVLEWWEDNKTTRSELYEVAKVLLAVPATQVSVERLFSGVKFIMNPTRNRLDEDSLNSVLVIRSNKDLF